MDIEIILKIIYASFCSFVLSIIFNKIIIKWQKKKEVYQIIRDDLSGLHDGKRNTPTFGGIAIFLSFIIVFLFSIIFINYDKKIYYFLLCTFCYFSIGFADDYFKIIKKDGKGLKAKLRLALEIIIVLLFMYLLQLHKKENWIINMPISNVDKYVGWTFIIFIIFVLVGTSNAVNLTDGLDGLSSGLLVIAIIPFSFICVNQKNYELLYISLMMIGSIVGFLIYNFHPAKIFMGDCGSLSIGFFLGGIAVLLNRPLLLLFSGMLFVIETLSVILQVFSYKLFKKRIFKMAPLHHHFEKIGIHEVKIVTLFYILGILMSIITILMEIS
ncbi:MAG: phospho-N-acetylmuramoyl-pentapeptide-transferase [Bacilli bacterium]